MMNSKYSSLLFILSGIITELDTAKILAFYPMPFLSHHMTYYPLTIELINKGHEVTVVTTDPYYTKEDRPENLTEIDIHDVSYTIKDQVMTEHNKDYNLFSKVYRVGYMYVKLFEQQIMMPEVQNVLKRDRNYFDLVLVEANFIPASILSHIYDAPLVLISSFGAFIHNLEAIGAPTHPFLYPTVFRKRIYNLSLWEKVTEMFMITWFIYLRLVIDKNANEIFRKHFGADAPTLDVLRNNIDMLLLNVNPIWNGNMPVPPGVVYIGGIHLKPQKELPEDIKSYLDSSKNGVIYVSFGSSLKASKITPVYWQKFINVFKKLPYDVLLKWDQDDFPERISNIRISKWLPQSDLLRHPKVKLFITQGGQQSTDEAIVAGVPLIGVPMIGDQWYNTEKYIYFKIGMKIELETFNEDNLRKAIDTVINDESYRKNVEDLRRKMYDRPQKPLEHAVWWIEYLLRHDGAKHLRAPAANMSWIEYYELKLIGVILIAVFIIMYILVMMLKYLWKLITKVKMIKLKRS